MNKRLLAENLREADHYYKKFKEIGKNNSDYLIIAKALKERRDLIILLLSA